MANFLQRALAFAVGLALLVVAFIFVSVVVALAVAIAMVLGGWLAWRTRHLRRDLERRAPDMHNNQVTIEGEYRRVDDR